VVSDLVTAGDDAPCGLREALNMATNQEECSAKLVFREHVKNALRVRAWPIIKRQRHCA
jgi:hypothetical protein